ncbi:subclass B3 metallo-beta-lactamase [Pseudoflavitalea sp. G-6-1-2]|uniref:subclass B3 metallo-beta-lactamase n=1 Tax=Pseudoflavitalea sp. G-6-1-2 TaxID=2728841 RepID=UPI00146C431B|nr:subclass B3 metallo-beta-lactamase [Pseudoflavitalea sp. G-6-1-2]NML23729.1 subclass B3 metallo-beta-lactamase [Pseudoflavitalea sp. G-6-1-2]
MNRAILTKITLIVCLFTASFSVVAQHVEEPANPPKEWTTSYKPFRIAGNLYYVGTYDLACYLITTSEGNILINTGIASSASQIKASIEALGFKYSDTRILLTTQVHHDHVGAMAAVKKATGAVMMVNEKDAQNLVTGGKNDYYFHADHAIFQPIKAERMLRNNDTITLGDTKLTMLHHPGHTPGSCSYLLDTKDEKRSWHVLIANMPSIIIEKKFSEVKEYPDMLRDYAYTLGVMKDLKFDLWLASHASQFDLHGKRKETDGYKPEAFIDQNGYIESIAEFRKAFDKKLAEE